MRRRALLLAFIAFMWGPFLAAQSADDGSLFAPERSDMYPGLRKGVDLYSQGKWLEAIVELRRMQSETFGLGIQSEAYFWISMAELYAGEFEAAVEDMEALAASDPDNSRNKDLYYHKGRAFYYLARYDEAIILFKNYIDAVTGTSVQDRSRRAAAYYWTGECLYSMGLFDDASKVFLILTEKYPESVKFEAASYRVALIRQKKVEAELLTLLKWSHEESLKTMEEYQRRERSYDQALIAYQKRISDMLRDDSRYTELEDANARYAEQLAAAEARIRALEKAAGAGGGAAAPASPEERLRSIKNSAREVESGLKR